MEAFWIIWLTIVVIAWYPKTPRQTLLLALPLAIFAGLRASDVDRDYKNYIEYFNSVNEIKDIFNSKINVEIWFKILTYITKFLDFQFSMQMLFIALISISIKLFYYKKLSPLFPIAIVAYISHFYLLQDMTQVRAGLASSIFLIALWNFNRSKPKYFIFTLIASLIHSSFIITFFLGFMVNNSKKKLTILSILPAFCIIFSLFNFQLAETLLHNISFIDPRLSNYLNILQDKKLNEINIFNTQTLSRIIIAYALFYFTLKNKIKTIFIPFIQFYMIAIGLYYLLCQSSALATRLSEILFTVEPILISLLVYTALRVYKNVYSYAITLTLFFFYSALLYMKTLEIMNDYSAVWFF
ncbi:EpsG family protein [Aquirhabdus parva]|uniref:EpsG family protein n=1 Tax=Aquirhabdus parva TaxID=2283318 RepID=A0A345PAF8_9GAMM|nr:EpsG family protein [Aquirhabdus parva]AXI04267.1 EpsG family protein [Aquirhabdus parva]